MSRTYPKLGRLTADGLSLFARVMTGQIDEGALDLGNPVFARPVEGTTRLEARSFSTEKEMAEAICRSLGGNSPQALAGDIGLWAWLTFALVDSLFPRAGGVRQIKELHRWYPAQPNDWRKARTAASCSYASLAIARIRP